MRTRVAVAPSRGAWIDARGSRHEGALRAVAILACLPYLSLKTAWVLGSTAGIPAGSSLLDGGATLRIANAVGVVMDAAVIVLALLLTRPWGLRVPAWLLVGPVWLATGLRTPIMLAYPAQVVARLFGDRPPANAASGDPFLAEWVFGVVYTGFIVQGLALGALFVLYARQRWSHLWVGRLADLPYAAAAPARWRRSGSRLSPCSPWPCTCCGRVARRSA